MTIHTKKDELVAYGAREFISKKFASVLSENKDTIQNWIGDRHQSQDSITYEGPIPLYTRPDNRELRKAAEEIESRLRNAGLEYDADYLRAALEGK